MANERLSDSRNPLLDVKSRTTPDELVMRAIATVEKRYLHARAARTVAPKATHAHGKGRRAPVALGDAIAGNGGRPRTTTSELLELARQRGIGAHILKLTTSLNRMRMDETSRLLLATPGVYESILLALIRDEKADPKDVEGLRPAVLLAVEGQPRAHLYAALLDEFAAAESLSIHDGVEAGFRAALIDRGVPLGAGKTSLAMKALFEEVQSEGKLRSFVDQYAARGEIDATRFSKAVRQSMVDYLETIGLEGLDAARFTDGDYDEYFAQAYHHAIFGKNGSVIPDPVPVPPPADEFRLPTYESIDEQGVVAASIHAAAALYQMYFIGDKLGLFEMPNLLLLRRAHGSLDLPSGSGSQLLQAYKRLQRTNDDVPAEERMLLYKRVFNLGNGKVLEDTAVNPEFPDYWDSLAREVTNYITKDEMSDAGEERISRAAIEEGIQNLQANLSFYAADIDEDVRVMKEQYALAEKVLVDPTLMASIGLVRRQTLPAAIEKLISEDHGASPMVSKLFKLGTKGQEILHFIADYDSSTPEEEFQRFLRLMEAWIVARGALKDDDLEPDQEAQPEESDDFAEDSVGAEAEW